MMASDAPGRDETGIGEARLRLVEPKPAEPVGRLLAASALMALSACTLAVAVILGPFWETSDPHLPAATHHSAHVASHTSELRRLQPYSLR